MIWQIKFKKQFSELLTTLVLSDTSYQLCTLLSRLLNALPLRCHTFDPQRITFGHWSLFIHTELGMSSNFMCPSSVKSPDNLWLPSQYRELEVPNHFTSPCPISQWSLANNRTAPLPQSQNTFEVDFMLQGLLQD